MKKSVSALLRIFISFGLLGLLFWFMKDDIGGILGILSDSNYTYVFIAMCLVLVNVMMLAYRMKIIFLGENLEITLRRSARLTFMGYFFNNFMPTAVGGDIIKAHYAAHSNNERLKSYASVLMDRFIGLYTFLIVAAIALVIDRGRVQSAAVRPIVFALLAVGVTGFIVATNRSIARIVEVFLARIKMMKLGEKLQAVYDIVHDYRNRKIVVLHAIIVSILAQCVYFSMIYILFKALGTNVNIGNIFLIMPVVTFISMIPSVGGLGVREGAIVAFFTPLAGKEAAFAVSLLVLLSLFFISAIGGVFYLLNEIYSGSRKKDN